jgi:ferritin-like protein
MSKASIELVRGDVDPAGLADELDGLYCYEQVVVHWCKAVENRLAGMATFVLPDELTEVADDASKVAERLAARIAQLGGEITADPTDFVTRAPINEFTLPDDFGDVVAILTTALNYQRHVIGVYAELLDRLGTADVVTHRLLTKILAGKLAREDELEAVVAHALTVKPLSSRVARLPVVRPGA